MSYVGGLRARLVADSVYHLIREALSDLGWLDTGRRHQQITIRTESVPMDQEIPLNTLVVSEAFTSDDEAEIGSNMGIVTTTFYVDFYAEKEALGKEVIHDIRDILKGRMPAIGRSMQNVPVYDWMMATPTQIFACDIQDVIIDQARDFPKPWQKYWYVCRFDIVDTYDAD